MYRFIRVGFTIVGGKFSRFKVVLLTEENSPWRRNLDMLPPLTPEQQLEADKFTELFRQIANRQAQKFGELIASRADNQLLGKTEFDLRDLVHQVGASFLEAALEERKKGGTWGAASSVPSASQTPT